MKYELTSETIKHDGVVLHRIRALKDFGDVLAGELGGWIEAEKNLSQHGTAWVSGNARVSGDARVYDDARVSGDEWVN